MVVNVLIGILKSVIKGEDEDIKNIIRLFFYYLFFCGIVNVFVVRELEFLDRFDFCFCFLLCIWYE